MFRKKKKGSFAVLVLSVVLSLFPMPKLLAADAIDTDASCKVEFLTGSGYEELKNEEIPIHLYKVADIDASGNYTPLEGFEELDVSSVKHDNASADIWLKRAKDAREMVKTNRIPVMASVTTDQGIAQIEGLQVGLYLVAVGQIESDGKIYTFLPCFISLPYNFYYTGGIQKDNWVYELTGKYALSLKVEQKEKNVPDKTTTAVETGDHSHTEILWILVFASGIVLLSVGFGVVCRRKR